MTDVIDRSITSEDRIPLLDVRNLSVEFSVKGRGGIKSGVVSAVSGITFHIDQGETLGVVGETGCGKSTMARAVLQAIRPNGGNVVFDGQELTSLRKKELRELRRHIQMIFQDPFSSVDPRWSVFEIVAEPLVLHGVGNAQERAARVNELLDLVGLDATTHGKRRPRQLSGGQCQRVAIARALALSPKLVVCDEAVSSLDVSIQAQVLNLLIHLRQRLGLSYLFIAHDLSVVKYVSDRVAVMYLGRICEVGPPEALYREPLHPYTSALLDAIPAIGKQPGRRPVVDVEAPSPINPPSGCRYRTRCPRAQERCALEIPELNEFAPGHYVACHYPNESVPVANPTVEADPEPDQRRS